MNKLKPLMRVRSTLLPLGVGLLAVTMGVEPGAAAVPSTAEAEPRGIDSWTIVPVAEPFPITPPSTSESSLFTAHPIEAESFPDSPFGSRTLVDLEAISTDPVPALASQSAAIPELEQSTPTLVSADVPALTQTPEPETPGAEPSDPAPTTEPTTEPTAEPTTKPDQSTTTPETTPSAERPDDLDPNQRQQILIEGDRLWLQGRREEAEFLYRKAKNPFQAVSVSDRPEPIYDPEQLSPAGRVYWREAEAGQETNLVTRIMVPLELLTEQYPEFIPGNIRYAEALIEQEQPEEALRVLERAATLYPNEPALIRARVTTLAAQEYYLEASIAARQYAVLNTDDPNAPEFNQLAEENLQEFQSEMRQRLTGSAIANVVTGALSYALTGGFIGPLSAIQTSVLMMRGESAVGESAAERIARRLDLIEDEAIVAYVNELGQRLANVSGRSDFEYRFYVVQDADLNAFALPGGKVFINAGAILEANSEAELAGLIAHELAHAVLSHGFQLMTQGSATANLLDIIPYGGYVTNLAVLSYSRDMERQADALGTRMIATAGFAADGLRNLMVTLGEQESSAPGFDWLSTHPDTSDRIRAMELQIEQNGYNRYAYEGVERHLAIQEQVRLLMEEAEATQTPDEKSP